MHKKLCLYTHVVLNHMQIIERNDELCIACLPELSSLNEILKQLYTQGWEGGWLLENDTCIVWLVFACLLVS